MKEPLGTVTEAGHRLGEYIRDQRRTSQISLRQLSALAGVSNPYLSQIERGLRKPSAEILQQIAKALRISAEAMYVQAGILEQREGGGAVADAILGDDGVNERQKQVLLEIYESFRRENAAARASAAATAAAAELIAVPAQEPVAGPSAPAAPPADLAGGSKRPKRTPKTGSTAKTGTTAKSTTDPTPPQEASS